MTSEQLRKEIKDFLAWATAPGMDIEFLTDEPVREGRFIVPGEWEKRPVTQQEIDQAITQWFEHRST